jgi:hypothetical protein
LKTKAQKPKPSSVSIPKSMNPLEGLDAAELISLSDGSFQERVKTRARALTAKAMTTIEDVMDSSDDDQARLMAAGKILNVAKVEQEDLKAIPLGISEEVMKIALAGFAQLASIARDTTTSAVLRDVTLAKSDPRKTFGLPDDSPMNTKVQSKPLDSYEVEGADVIEENLNVED